MPQHVSYRTIPVDGLSIFYREAGPTDAPTILLLHGLPSSSRMFEPLLTRLAGQFHLVTSRLSGLRAQRCADTKGLLVHLRQHRHGDGSLHRGVESG